MLTPEVDGLRADEVYQYITGREAPEALVAAAGREAEMVTHRESVSSPPAEFVEPSFGGSLDGNTGDIAVAVQGLNGYEQWFKDSFCGRQIEWMWSNSWGKFYFPDKRFVDSTVSVYKGDTVLHECYYRPYSSWRVIGSTKVKNGYYNRQHRTDVHVDFDFRCQTSHVGSGDWYHWCAGALD